MALAPIALAGDRDHSDSHTLKALTVFNFVRFQISLRTSVACNLIQKGDDDMAKLAKKANPTATSEPAAKNTISTKEIVRDNLRATSIDETSSKQLEDEIKRLQALLAKVKANNEAVDPASVLATRSRFLDLAGAEFNRANRYGRDLTMIVAKVSGYQRVLENYGPEAAEHVMFCVTEICTSATRLGVDILGRIEDNKIAMLLPETDLEGGENCLDRINKLVAEQPIMIDGEAVKVGMMFSARPLRKEHFSFEQLLASA